MQETQCLMLSPKEFAKRLSVSRWTIYSWLQQGTIKGVKVGNRLVRIPESELNRIIQRGTQEVIGK